MRKIFISSLFVFIILAGCSNDDDAYNNAIQKGLDYIASEEYQKAEGAFELALDEKKNDEKATALLQQTVYYQDALKAIDEGELDSAKEKAEKVINIENGSSALIKKAEKIIVLVKNNKSDKEDVVEKESTNDDNDESNNQSEEKSKPKKDNTLSGYTDDEIEYARVWLQTIGNQDTEELNVYHISVGELVNPYSEADTSFPEDLIALGGKIMADGSVTYSGNGDGSINVYNVPSHFPTPDEIKQSGKTEIEYAEDIINNTEKIYVDPGDDDTVEKMIKKINIHH